MSFIGISDPFVDAFTPRLLNYSPMKWWKLMKVFAPELSEVALRRLSIPPTAECSESNWKIFTQHYTNKRSRLSSNTRKQLLFLAANTDDGVRPNPKEPILMCNDVDAMAPENEGDKTLQTRDDIESICDIL
eukprot:TRINITY_DN2028_c0_g2_i2.p1 TRINITY_DN2028_c0_g2~~TRINITY_DN2028_c0_g2_i2.p1  ORF type:complete len:132 (-),score=18.34 TRINITY_DN2028_c0_g2_i2:158-553(-)